MREFLWKWTGNWINCNRFATLKKLFSMSLLQCEPNLFFRICSEWNSINLAIPVKERMLGPVDWNCCRHYIMKTYFSIFFEMTTKRNSNLKHECSQHSFLAAVSTSTSCIMLEHTIHFLKMNQVFQNSVYTHVLLWWSNAPN